MYLVFAGDVIAIPAMLLVRDKQNVVLTGCDLLRPCDNNYRYSAQNT